MAEKLSWESRSCSRPRGGFAVGGKGCTAAGEALACSLPVPAALRAMPCSGGWLLPRPRPPGEGPDWFEASKSSNWGPYSLKNCIATLLEQAAFSYRAGFDALNASSTLQEDLQLSDSEESGDDQVVEKPPSSSAPPSALLSQPVLSALSSSSESGSSSDSKSSSDSETESSSSEADPPIPNKWQLDNWLSKGNPPSVPAESCEEGKEQGRGTSGSSSHQHTKPREPHHKSSSRAARAPQNALPPTKHSCQRAPVCEGPKGGLKVEARDQAATDNLKGKKKGQPKSNGKDLKLAPREHPTLPVNEKKRVTVVKDTPACPPLVVKVPVALLSRVPQPPRKGQRRERAEANKLSAGKEDLKRKNTDTPEKPPEKKKRKMEEESGRKKRKSLQSSAKKDSSKLKEPKASCETQQKDLVPLPLPRFSPAPNPTKVARKRQRSASGERPATGQTAGSENIPEDPLGPKLKKVPRNHAELPQGIRGSAGDVPSSLPRPSLPNGTSKPRRPQLQMAKQQPVEYYMAEAKRLKHEADAMTDKTAKAFRYLEAVLSYIEAGIALELDKTTKQAAYRLFRDTIDLLRFIMTLKPFMGPSASSHQKIFAVLCMRCQALLHMAVFRFNKEMALNYSRILNDHFQTSSRVTQAPSPCSASSASSQPCSGSSVGSSAGVPYDIPGISSSFVNITSYILHAYNSWGWADALARENEEFFADLSKATCTLALNSSVAEAVRYARQALLWLRLEASTP